MSSVNWQKYHGANETKAMLRHNDKEKRVEDNHSNPDINKEKTEKNLNLIGGTYEEKCAAYDKKIADYKKAGNRLRKDAVTCIGLNIKLPPFLSGLDVTYDQQVDWIKKCLAVVSDFVNPDNIISATADFDEIHWYDSDKGMELSRPELDVRFVPLYDGKLKGSDFACRKNFHRINCLIHDMTLREYGFSFMTGEDAGRESTDSLKARSTMRELKVMRTSVADSEAVVRDREAKVKAREDAVTAREDVLNDEALLTRERKVKAREDAVTTRETELNDREAQLKAREDVLNDEALLTREEAIKAREDAEDKREKDEDEREADFSARVDEAVERRLQAREKSVEMHKQAGRAGIDLSFGE